MHGVCWGYWNLISIHAPPRGATIIRKEDLRFSRRISIHAPPRGATPPTPTAARSGRFQFTPLREGRHQIMDLLGRPYTISIHAPPRGATRRFARQRGQALHISIHAPPRGATVQHPARQCVRKISIHAPPRGATAKDMQFLQIFCSTLTNQHGLTIVPRNLSRLFW